MTYFESLIGELRNRSARAIQSLLALKHPALRDHLTQQLMREPGQKGAILADPVFEPTFSWRKSEESLGTLEGSLLHPSLVRNMVTPLSSTNVDPFPRDRKVYSHQLEAWKILGGEKPKSLVVTSGTGSGKTECFMVPVLDSLARDAARNGTLQGVQALMIYPLNALISSQQNRLDAWTDGFDGKVRYCLYTGALNTTVKKGSSQTSRGHVPDRKSLRESAPPLLVTNATMLEYMLVRKDDAPILEQSAGKLRWIILDEAHTYVGSQAAEMALLLRRVMYAFKVEPKDVRFVATSATFGSDQKTIDSLKLFLAHMAGVDISQIEVVQGHREVPILPLASSEQDLNFNDIAAIDAGQVASPKRYEALANHPLARALRSAFITESGTQVNKLSSLSTTFSGTVPSESLLAWLSVLSGTQMPDGIDDPFFLPLRLHLFHDVLQGLQVCVDRACPAKANTPLADSEWPYGMVHSSDRTECSCGAPVVSLVSCTSCNEAFLLGRQTKNGNVSSVSRDAVDEFALDLDRETDDEEEDQVPLPSGGGQRWLIVNRKAQLDTEDRWLDREEHRLCDHQPEGDAALLEILVLAGSDQCPCCKDEAPQNVLFRSAVIGTPLLLSTVIPALLEFCPADKNGAFTKPFSGRKMISFTDSRQGTARIAAKLQQDSERLRVRSLIYHHLLNEDTGGQLPPDEEAELAELIADEERDLLSVRDKRQLQKLRDTKAKLQSGAVLSWDQLCRMLAMSQDVGGGILTYYTKLADELFAADVGATDLAGIFLAREFMRRPKARNNLESMGLVEIVYPQLGAVTAPTGWPGTDTDWRAYLKVLLDFFVRENTYVRILPEWQRFIGTRFMAKSLLSPQTEALDAGSKRLYRIWPSVKVGRKRQSRPINLLCDAFGLSPDTSADKLDYFLQEAWEALTDTTKLLTGEARGVQLDLNKLHFRLSSTVWQCPVTRKFLDTVFANLSPYGAAGSQNSAVPLPQFQIPKYPHSNAGAKTDVERIAEARQWLVTDSTVKALLDEGLWSDLHDRIIESAPFFRAAEHSAQQKDLTLRDYEKQFSEGQINLLSCSTTMEMGIDISGISAVANNNVPPQPANYLQRAGRAGRRGEGRAIALTVCRRTPHDQHIFAKPDWPFVTDMVVPKVSLRSPDLITRHLNAFLLAYWLKEVLGYEELRSMTVGSFFTCNDQESGHSASLAERFSYWCRHDAPTLEPVSRQLKALVDSTVLALTTPEVLSRRTADGIANITESWLKEYEYAMQEKAYFEGENEAKSAALRALMAQLDLLTGAYLLKELATRRFLPGYGFPTDIVTFNPIYKAPRAKGKGVSQREDKWGQSRDLPSRDRITGLREYAPGAEIVLDGLVYRSQGLTLNWKLPATQDDVKEAQMFKWAWRCNACGATGSTFMLEPSNCECCGSDLKKSEVWRYLVPNGFAVVFGDLPHTDVDHPTYVPIQPARLSVNEPWVPLANPANGFFRASDKAHMFHHTAGAFDTGFALCLECGLAEPMLSTPDPDVPEGESTLPGIFRSASRAHRRLRGGKYDDKPEPCPGHTNRWKIQSNVRLGHDGETDAIELLLRNPTTGAWLRDKVAAFTISVALREAIAKATGVLPEELGFSTRQVEWEGQAVQLVQVFDQRSGGYATQAALEINTSEIWHDVEKTLNCPHCQSACENCLVGFDTRFDADKLDRLRALEWINAAWRNGLSLPDDEKAFGPGSVAETTSLLEAVAMHLAKHGSGTVNLYLQGTPEQWDLALASTLLDRVASWCAGKLSVRLIATAGTLEQLGEGNRYRLAALVDSGASYGEVPRSYMMSGNTHFSLVSLELPDSMVAWASKAESLGIPVDSWARNVDGYLIVRGNPDHSATKPHNFAATEIRPVSGDAEVDIAPTDLDGKLIGFGKQFWSLLTNRSPALRAAFAQQDVLECIEYSDRYIRNPFTVALFVEVVDALRHAVTEATSSPRVIVKGQQYQSTFLAPTLLWHDWPSHEQRDEAMQAALEYVGFSSEVRSDLAIDHGRMLRLTFNSGRQIRVRLDMGFSYWRMDRQQGQRYRNVFGFSEETVRQGEALNRLDANVAVTERWNTQVFVRV